MLCSSKGKIVLKLQKVLIDTQIYLSDFEGIIVVKGHLLSKGLIIDFPTSVGLTKFNIMSIVSRH